MGGVTTPSRRGYPSRGPRGTVTVTPIKALCCFGRAVAQYSVLFRVPSLWVQSLTMCETHKLYALHAHVHTRCAHMTTHSCARHAVHVPVTVTPITPQHTSTVCMHCVHGWNEVRVSHMRSLDHAQVVSRARAHVVYH
jgi:hypothetical protein